MENHSQLKATRQPVMTRYPFSVCREHPLHMDMHTASGKCSIAASLFGEVAAKYHS